MKSAVAVIAVLAVVLFASPALAQSPAPPGGGQQPPAPSGTAPASPAPPGPAGHGPGAGMPMDMCKEMMSGHAGHGGMMGQGMMGPGMMGMSGPEAMDPQVLEMRGEMMKAMGEIMMKHARKMRGATTTKPR